MLCVYKLNGIYDIVCALCILNRKLYIPIISDLHLSLFKYKQDKVANRMFGYWIFTYGIMRMSSDKNTIIVSYMIESIFLFNEYKKDTMINRKVFFCILGCILFILYSI